MEWNNIMYEIQQIKREIVLKLSITDNFDETENQHEAVLMKEAHKISDISRREAK